MIIKKSDVILVEEYNGTVLGLFMDPWFTNLLKQYFELLEGDEWDAYQISERSYIENILLKNKLRQEAKYVSMMNNPMENISEAIKRVCKAVPMYQSFKDSNVTEKDIKNLQKCLIPNICLKEK